MTISSAVFVFFVAFVSFFGGYFAKNLSSEERIYRLEKPLRITTDDPDKFFALPAGTVLYLDSQPKEGGYDRYRIYVNIFGPDLPTVPAPGWNYIDPLTAFQSD